MARFSRSDLRKEIISSIIFGTVVRFRADSAVAGNAPERTILAVHNCVLSPAEAGPSNRQGRESRCDRRPRAARVIEWNDREFFRVNVEPDVEFGPVGRGKTAYALISRCGSSDVQSSGRWFFGSIGREHRGRSRCAPWRAIFLVAASAAKAALNPPAASASRRARGFKRPQILRAERERFAPRSSASRFGGRSSRAPNFFRVRIAEGKSFREFVARVDMEQRNGILPDWKAFLCQPEHDGKNPCQSNRHHGIRKLGYGFAQDVNALALQVLRDGFSPFSIDGIARAAPLQRRRLLDGSCKVCVIQSFPFSKKCAPKKKIPPTRSSGGGNDCF